MAIKPTIKDVDDLILEHATKKLGDAPLHLLKDAGVEGDYTYTTRTAPKVKFGIEADAQADIYAFNGADDVDADGILGDRNDEQDGPTAFPPQVDLNTSGAWLKYRFDANVKGTAAGSLKQLGFKFDAEKQLVVADYRKHSADEVVYQAIGAKVQMKWADIRRMGLRHVECAENNWLDTSNRH